MGHLQDECESLKLRLEGLQSEKSPSSLVAATLPPAAHSSHTEQIEAEYAHFQETNKHLQVEIESLKTCIDNQASLNEELQRQLNTFHNISGGQKIHVEGLGADQGQVSSYFEAHGTGLHPQHSMSHLTSHQIT